MGSVTKRLRLFACLVLLTATTACATKAPLKFEGVAQNGKDYAETLKKVNAFAFEHSLEFTADLLPSLPRSAQTLEQQTAEMKQRLVLVQQADVCFDTLALYFAQLEALVQGDQSQATEQAVAKFADALKRMPQDFNWPEVNKKELTGLAVHVSQWQHANAVEHALKRDADVIAQALVLNQEILDEQIHWITLREKLVRLVAYRDNVEQPFLSDKKLTETWKKAWVANIKTPASIELLEQAKQASEIMQQAWLGVLQGQDRFGPLQATLKQISLNVKEAAIEMKKQGDKK